MKKTVSSILIAMIITLGSGAIFANESQGQKPTGIQRDVNRQNMRKQFEQRLNLSEKQKEKAAQIHKDGKAQIKPVIMKIDLKRQEIETVKLSRMAERAQQERIAELEAEIKDLEKQAREIRKKNTVEFEKLLNKKQKVELERMKAEGRARFEQHHQPRAPFGGLGSPSFFFRPILPPEHHNENSLWR